MNKKKFEIIYKNNLFILNLIFIFLHFSYFQLKKNHNSSKYMQ